VHEKSSFSSENRMREKSLFSGENRAREKSLLPQKGMCNMSMFWQLITYETSQLITNFSVCMYVSESLISKNTSRR